jgi:hypothetical protein
MDVANILALGIGLAKNVFAFFVAKRCTNRLHPPRDGSEKYERFPRGARETMVARYKKWQLGVSGWSARRKALGFFGHVTWQASGSHDGNRIPHAIFDEPILESGFAGSNYYHIDIIPS